MVAPRCFNNFSFLQSRLKQEGAQLAEEARYWEAISRWNAALEIEDRQVGGGGRGGMT